MTEVDIFAIQYDDYDTNIYYESYAPKILLPSHTLVLSEYGPQFKYMKVPSTKSKSLNASLDRISNYFMTEMFVKTNSVFKIRQYYSPFGIENLSTYQSIWANPYFAYYYNVTSSTSTGIQEVVFTDGENVTISSPNMTVIIFPDNSVLAADHNGNRLYSPSKSMYP